MTLISIDQALNATSRLGLFLALIVLEAMACDVPRIESIAYFNMLPTAFRIAFMALENASFRNYVSLNLNTLWHACL
ncbi:MAG TPA: hypothetical protein VIU12_29615 [Chryseolinea sp.]